MYHGFPVKINVESDKNLLSCRPLKNKQQHSKWNKMRNKQAAANIKSQAAKQPDDVYEYLSADRFFK